MTTPAIIIQQRQPTVEITQTTPQTIIARIPVATGGSGEAIWGGIAGTLADQTDLKNALDAKSATTHNHAGTYEPSGAIATHAALTDVHGLDNKADLVGGFVPSSQLPSLIALGETSTTAYRGDRGKTAYDHSQTTGNPHGTTPGDITGFDAAALNAAPAETTTTVGTLINDATAKATPVDADFVGLMDSGAANVLKKLSWANTKATLKTYFDTLYNNYTHPTGDGNQHVPATSTTNSGKVLTAGATAGALSWETPSGGGLTIEETQTANFNMADGTLYPCNTTAGAFTATLPATPTAGMYCEIWDFDGTFATNPLTIGRNGSLINGVAEDLVIDIANARVSFLYCDATKGWQIDIGGSDFGTGIDASGFDGNLAATDNTIQKVAQAVDDLNLLTLSSIQALGVQSVDFAVTPVANAYVTYTTVTTGTAAVAMTLVNPTPTTNVCKQVVAILQGATARVITLKGTDANVISSGGLMSSGDALPNSGANTLDVFTFEWNGARWETIDARYDVKA